LEVLFEAVYLLTMGRLSGTTSVLKNPGTIGKNGFLGSQVGMVCCFKCAFWRDIVKPQVFGGFCVHSISEG